MLKFLAGFILSTLLYFFLIIYGVLTDPFYQASYLSEEEMKEIAKERAIQRYLTKQPPEDISVYKAPTKLTTSPTSYHFTSALTAPEGHSFNVGFGLKIYQISPALVLERESFKRVCISKMEQTSYRPNGDLSLSLSFYLKNENKEKLLSLLGDEEEKRFMLEDRHQPISIFHTSSSSPMSYQQHIRRNAEAPDFTLRVEKDQIAHLLWMLRDYSEKNEPLACSSDVDLTSIPLWDELAKDGWGKNAESIILH